MKQLILVRHGKSTWSMVGIQDMDRPLKVKGIHNTFRMASHLQHCGVVPDALWSSPACRALHTALIMARGIDFNLSNVQVAPWLYECEVSGILERIAGCEDDITTLMLVGHNPVFTLMANRYLPLSHLPTSGVAIIDLDLSSWRDVKDAPAIEARVYIPSQL